MSGLLFLSEDYFKTMNTQKGDVLGTTIRGISLILFYSTQCPYCEPFIPVFKKLPGTVGGCQFGMINISTNRSIVEKSKNTIMPLTYVPYIVLYNNGQPLYLMMAHPTNKNLKILSCLSFNQTRPNNNLCKKRNPKLLNNPAPSQLILSASLKMLRNAISTGLLLINPRRGLHPRKPPADTHFVRAA
jgi:thiol-disulfide isomerase/thioredoxin